MKIERLFTFGFLIYRFVCSKTGQGDAFTLDNIALYRVYDKPKNGTTFRLNSKLKKQIRYSPNVVINQGLICQTPKSKFPVINVRPTDTPPPSKTATPST